jgi:inward rectifier potassium channel
MTVSWPVFFASAAVIFIILNAAFAALYMLGDHPVANVSDDLPLSLFYFSIETLATVGYGDMTCTRRPIMGTWSPPWKSSPACRFWR